MPAPQRWSGNWRRGAPIPAPHGYWDVAFRTQAPRDERAVVDELGARLRECCTLLTKVRGRSALQVFGSIDAIKLRSCLTLFEHV